MANQTLHSAKKQKKDEFYTQLSDIEKELKHYKSHFNGKTVLCNCDDPRVSNFFKYFSYNFEYLGLKKLISTCYKNQDADWFSKHDVEKAIWLEYNGDKNGNRVPDANEIGIREFNGDGDFRSDECIELLKQADIVVTNPPFSLFREYVAQLMEYGKKFLIIGNKNAVTYKEVFKAIKENHLWLGVRNINDDMWLFLPDDEEKYEKIVDGRKMKHIQACWFTNLDHRKRNENLILYKKYTPQEFPKYDNYEAINVDKVVDIPCDYDGVMGVPITFLDKYNPAQFEILGDSRYHDGQDFADDINIIKGKGLYRRILIRRRKK
ncbi:adenine-specific methyltransferase EcoRI family protein [Intestinicryptomonas porci]|uniref:Adenine-specific methyltransferase EcoRI family protein n=1 Tax=Intestinicryptomonas porci TaxID=2926320 RepID=A0ABU4WH67_9BACT|nr:adenine-specific methyltransferase EcoRI family protein [Opitutales bacterium CLA-KB-P66]